MKIKLWHYKVMVFTSEREEKRNKCSFDICSEAMHIWTKRQSLRHEPGADHTMTAAYKGPGCTFENVEESTKNVALIHFV